MEENNNNNKIYQVIITMVFLIIIIFGIGLKSNFTDEKSQKEVNS